MTLACASAPQRGPSADFRHAVVLSRHVKGVEGEPAYFLELEWDQPGKYQHCFIRVSQREYVAAGRGEICAKEAPDGSIALEVCDGW